MLRISVNSRLGHSKESGDPCVVSAISTSPASEPTGLVLPEVCGGKPQKQNRGSLLGDCLCHGSSKDIWPVTSGSDIGMNQPSISSSLHHCSQGSKSGKPPAGPASPHACPWQRKHPDWQSPQDPALGGKSLLNKVSGCVPSRRGTALDGGLPWSHGHPVLLWAFSFCHD